MPDHQATLAAMIELSRAALEHIRDPGCDGIDPERLILFFDRRQGLFAQLKEAPVEANEALEGQAGELLELDRTLVELLQGASAGVKRELLDLHRGKRALRGYRHQTRPKGSTLEA